MIVHLASLSLFVQVLVEGNNSSLSEKDRLRLLEAKSRIVPIEEAPFAVFVKRAYPEGGSTYCSGSIITKDWVITAGHCFGDFTYSVYAGTNSKADLETEAQIRQVSQSVLHPMYNDPADLTHDIGLLKTVASFEFGPKVRSIDLYAREWEGSPNKDGSFGQGCNSFGWGYISDTAPSEFLRAATFNVRAGKGACFCYPDTPDHRVLCSERSSNIQVCGGDSGGPLVCRFLLAGVTSAHYDDAICPNNRRKRQCLTGFNAISRWAYVCPMIGWMKTIIPELPEQPPSCVPGPPPTGGRMADSAGHTLRSSLFRIQSPGWAAALSLGFLM